MSGFKLGELIISCAPYVYVLNNTWRGKRCDYCFEENDDLKRCTQCSFVWFCNRLCQEKAWEFHKLECKLIKNAKPMVPPSDLRMIALILLKLKRDGDENPCEEVSGRKVTFKSLMSHAEEMEKDKTRSNLIMDQIADLMIYLPQSKIPSRALFMQVYGKLYTNSFFIPGDESEILGAGLYLRASVFDHSCDPDAEVVFNGVDIIIRAVKDIPHRDINKVSICYIKRLDLTKDRQYALMDRFNFTCKCSRCSSSDSDELMSKLLVPEDDVRDKLKEFKEGLEQLQKMDDDDKTDPLSLYTAAMDQLAAQDEVLADTHVLRVKTLKIAFDACIQIDQWSEAIVIGRQLFMPYRLYYGPYSSAVGLHLSTLGKTEALLKISSSTKTLEEAETILKVTHGEDHPLYQNLLKTISNVREIFMLSQLNSIHEIHYQSIV